MARKKTYLVGLGEEIHNRLLVYKEEMTKVTGQPTSWNILITELTNDTEQMAEKIKKLEGEK